MDVRQMDDIAYLLDVISRHPSPNGQLQSALCRHFGIVHLPAVERELGERPNSMV
jgi:hypothetical protein